MTRDERIERIMTALLTQERTSLASRWTDLEMCWAHEKASVIVDFVDAHSTEKESTDK